MSLRSGKLDGITFVWLDKQKNGKVTSCNKCLRRVWPEEPRMQYHDNNGQFTNKGTSSSYWCTTCAKSRGIQAPVPEVVGEQERLEL